MRAILIQGGRVIDPASGRNEVADVRISDGRIAQIAPGLSPGDAQRIDAAGCLVTPGLVDPHVHLREPGHEHKETIATGTAAAVAGGFTTVCCMPNTRPALDTPEMVHFVRSRASETGLCRVFPVAAATEAREGVRPAPMGLLAQAGAVAFSDDGDAIASAGVMAAVFAQTAALDKVFMQHCQDPTMTAAAQMHAGSLSARLGLGGWPREAEEIIIERDVRLARAAGARYHVQHISSRGSIDIIRCARAEGLPVTAEASPHHLLLTHERVLIHDESSSPHPDPFAKVNPPLREDADVQSLRQAVADGTITVLATDHAPHSDHEKSAPFEDAPMGMIGLESALPLYAKALIETDFIDWPRLIALLTIEPARLCNLDTCGIGKLETGNIADVTVIDPDLRWTISESELAGKSTNTPFMGWEVRGRAVATIVGGVLRVSRRP